MLNRKISAAFVRLARMYIITKEAVRPYGKLNQTLRSQDELEIGFLPVLFLRLRSFADMLEEGKDGAGEREVLNALRQKLSHPSRQQFPAL